tara:strand:- start:10666 stop:11550 length:885 start_codon:yes stop_codon:yes gene_type:complete
VSPAGHAHRVQIQDPDDPRVADYRNVPDPELIRERGLFVAEGRRMVRTLLTEARFPARSVLATEAAYRALGGVLDAGRRDMPVYVAAQACLDAIAGFHFHRGCLALGERPPPMVMAEVLSGLAEGPAVLVLLDNVGNLDNVGAIFRNAAAFDAAAVLLSPGCCDPLYRKAIRTSIGASLRLPFGTLTAWPGDLAELTARGFTLAALTPDPPAVTLGEFVASTPPRRLVLLLGAEGDGLSDAARDAADVAVRVPLAAGVDSINVATAAGIVLQRLAETRTPSESGDTGNTRSDGR